MCVFSDVLCWKLYIVSVILCVTSLTTDQLKALHCSIAMLQETPPSEAEHLKLKRDWVEQVYNASYKGERKRGVAILFGRNVFF